MSATANPINQKAFIKTEKKSNKKITEKEMETAIKKSESEAVVASEEKVTSQELLKSQEVEIQQLVSLNKSKEEEIKLLKSMVAESKYNETVEAAIPNVLKITKSVGNLLEPLSYLRVNNTRAYEAILKSFTKLEQVVQVGLDAVHSDLPQPEAMHVYKSTNPVDLAYESLGPEGR